MFIVFASFLWLLPSVARAVNCDTDGPGALQAAIDAATGPTTILVSGTCNENVAIREDKNRISLDGQGTATISGPVTTSSVIQVRGRGITILNFAFIAGGQDGILVTRGGTADIQSNTIQSTGGNGLVVNSHSFARIINNTIQNNPLDGIVVSENSSARVGFLSFNDTAASPNTIQGNGYRGVTVVRSSNAVIVGNTISNNVDDGVVVSRDSQADMSDNIINSNGGSGIFVSRNSGVNLGNDTGTSIFDLPNSTTVNNTGFGIECVTNSYADGRQGTVTGVTGATSFSSSCVNSLIP